MPGLNKNRRQEATRRLRALSALRGFARRFAGDRRANVLILFGLTLPILLAIVIAGIDFSYAEDAKVTLQDASDAASLAVSAEVVKNPNDSIATLKTIAGAALAANDRGGANLSITDFHVCAPVQADCTDGSRTMPSDTVMVAAQASAPCLPIPIPTTVCTGNPPSQTVTGTTTTVIGFGQTLQLNVVMDSSASMIVGSTQADVTAIANWMGATTTVTEKCGSPSKKQKCTQYPNWNAMMPNDQVADFPLGGTPAFPSDAPPCAFACHDLGGSTTPANIVEGLNNAHTAGAKTRFDVMVLAAQQLINSVQTELGANNNLAKNNYVFNVYSFDNSIHQYGSSNMTCTATACSGPLNAVTAVTPGMDTYLNAAMASFSAASGTNAIGPNGTGLSTASPLKFMILVTDGLQSDRNANWTASGVQPPNPEPEWDYSTNSSFKTITGGFDGPIDTTNCAKLKSEGVVLAVLETPYVPLTGEDPQVQPYEQTVRHTIYPGGPNSQSTISTALQACATTGYYFQAVSSSDIATGFLTLTNQFIQHSAYISQ